MGNAVVFAVGALGIFLLPELTSLLPAAWSEVREVMRRLFIRIVELLIHFRIFVHLRWCLKRLCNRDLSSLCKAPHSAKAQAIDSSTLVLWWREQKHQYNPFHEERYLVAWREVTENTGSADAETQNDGNDKWRENIVELCDLSDPDDVSGDPRRRKLSALMEDLPAQATLRLKVCALNSKGRSEWSREEIEVDLPKSRKFACKHAEQGMGRSRVVSSALHCIQCKKPQERVSLSYSSVACKPVIKCHGCIHGPFCVRCRRRISGQVLASCICNALIDAWHDGPCAQSTRLGPAF